jgi:hypothetical protein
MESKRSVALSAVVLIAIFILVGCASPPITEFSEHLPPLPNATIGPEMQLLRIPTSGNDRGSAVLDDAGDAHVIIAAAKLKEIRYLVIGPEGVLSDHVMRTHSAPDSVSIAFDQQGRLHALIDDEHLMLKDGHWIGHLRTPWSEAGAHPYLPSTFGPGANGPEFVMGASDLSWAFMLRGGDLNLGRRLEFVGGVNLAIPWVSKISKLVVVPEETPYKHWNVVGMEDYSDTGAPNFMADKKGNMYVTYTPETPGEVGPLSYASFCANCDCPKPVPEPKREPKSDAEKAYYASKPKNESQPRLPNGTEVCAIEGASIEKLVEQASRYYRAAPSQNAKSNLGYPLGWAVDPQSSDMLLVTTRGTALERNSAWGGFSQLPFTNIRIMLSPAGHDRYHALALGTLKTTPGVQPLHPFYYLAYSNLAWSAPIEIGRLGVMPARMSTIVSDAQGRSLVLWPTKDAIVGRWIMLK